MNYLGRFWQGLSKFCNSSFFNGFFAALLIGLALLYISSQWQNSQKLFELKIKAYEEYINKFYDLYTELVISAKILKPTVVKKLPSTVNFLSRTEEHFKNLEAFASLIPQIGIIFENKKISELVDKNLSLADDITASINGKAYKEFHSQGQLLESLGKDIISVERQLDFNKIDDYLDELEKRSKTIEEKMLEEIRS